MGLRQHVKRHMHALLAFQRLISPVFQGFGDGQHDCLLKGRQLERLFAGIIGGAFCQQARLL